MFSKNFRDGSVEQMGGGVIAFNQVAAFGVQSQFHFLSDGKMTKLQMNVVQMLTSRSFANASDRPQDGVIFKGACIRNLSTHFGIERSQVKGNIPFFLDFFYRIPVYE